MTNRDAKFHDAVWTPFADGTEMFWAWQKACSVADRIEDLWRERTQEHIDGELKKDLRYMPREKLGMWRVTLGTRRASDARGWDAVWLDAHREHAQYLECRDQWPPSHIQSMLDQEDLRRRYDNADQGGEHAWMT